MEFSRGYEKVRFRNNLRPYLGGLYEFGSYFPHTSLPAEYIYRYSIPRVVVLEAWITKGRYQGEYLPV